MACMGWAYSPSLALRFGTAWLYLLALEVFAVPRHLVGRFGHRVALSTCHGNYYIWCSAHWLLLSHRVAVGLRPCPLWLAPSLAPYSATAWV